MNSRYRYYVECHGGCAGHRTWRVGMTSALCASVSTCEVRVVFAMN